jgi:hypothetical protein
MVGPKGAPMRRLLLLLLPLSLLMIPIAEAAPTDPYDPYFASPATVADFGATTRPFGIAAGDYDGDGAVDLVVGRTTGNIAFVKGNGDGTFAAPSVFAWKQVFFNAWAFTAADVNGDDLLDVVWGASAAYGGVADGDVRAFLGNGDGTFQSTGFFNEGVLLGHVGPADAGSVAAGDIDGDGDTDLVAGVANAVTVLRNDGSGIFTQVPIDITGIYYPATSTQNSPWGLAFGDADGDGDLDLFVADRALYVYLYRNDGSGAFTMATGYSDVATRPNLYLRHDTYRAAVGYTPSLAAGDVNGDGKADLIVTLHSGTQSPASGVTHDGEVLLDLSTATGHRIFGILADIGTMARGATLVDVTGDGALDVIAAAYEGNVTLLRQLAPMDTDGDGVSDYVDNAPLEANAPRLDMNTDGSVSFADQLDNDFDTVLGDPEDPATWVRLGDPADPDDDNDGVADGADLCPFVADPAQGDVDGDGVGDACDPLDDRDPDGDGVPTGPVPGDPLYELARDSAITWSMGDTHFVLRIDALGRFFQNEFTQLMTDAATLTPVDWAAKCWDNYDPGDIPGDPTYEPCGDDATKTLTLAGGKDVPISLVVIPKQLWTDPPVVAWVNDRNANPNFDLGQHMTYHANNTPVSDWADMPDRSFYSCEMCGLTEAEVFELGKVGYDTLMGDYTNKWVAESGATAASPRIDWSDAAIPLISFAPPYNTSDTLAREAIAQLGFKAFSASAYEEGAIPGYEAFGAIFTPEGSHHEQFDQFGMFHVSADLQLAPPDTSNGTYDVAAYAAYLESKVDPGGLTTWLIEEVDWSGRPCNDVDRLGTCNGGSNRENNTVYDARWNGWMQALDFVNDYPGGVAMTMAEVALAKGFDNAPTVPNPDQADADHDGVGDVIDGAVLSTPPATLSRNVPGTLTATLANGVGEPIAGQSVMFDFDADGDGIFETYVGVTDAAGTATVEVTATRPVGPASFTAEWDGVRAAASATGDVAVVDATTMTLDPANPPSGQVTDPVTVGATLTDSDGAPVAGKTVSFGIGPATASGTTDAAGHVSATIVLSGPAGDALLTASFAGDGPYGPSSDAVAFTVEAEATVLVLSDAIAFRRDPAAATATLTEEDGAPVEGAIVEFLVEVKVKKDLTLVSLGAVATAADGTATMEVPTKYVSKSPRPIMAVFTGDGSFLGSTAGAVVYR